MNMTKTELAYLAGIVDGEGCFTIEINPPTTYRKGTLYTCRLTITNTDKRLLDWLLDKVGGTVFARKIINGRKPCFSWRIYANGIDIIVPKIIPYLICKKEEALVIMKFRSTFKNGRSNKNTKVTCDFRHQCLKELKFHNLVGTP
jgi:hypothetical protein